MVRFGVGVLVGAILSAASVWAFVHARVDTNGVLVGYIVQDSNGKEVCRDPQVWNQFRGPESYIVCN